VLVGEAAPRLGREGKGITSNMINFNLLIGWGGVGRALPGASSPYIESDGGLISRAFVHLTYWVAPIK